MRQRNLLFIALVTRMLLLGCGGDEQAGSEPCAAGQSVACTCPSGAQGTATCGPTGAPGLCTCGPAAPGNPDGGSTTDATGDGDDGSPVDMTPGTGDGDVEGAEDGGGISAGDGDAPPGETGPGSAFGAADPGKAGPFTAKTEANVGPGNAFMLVRPDPLGQGGVRHPIITWGNGTGATPDKYQPLLNQLASHGFVVIASNSTNTGSGAEMLQGVDWVIEQAGTSGSELFDKVDTSHVGATGHSQGGFGTTAAGHDERIDTIAPIQGFGDFSFGGGGGSGFHGPLFVIAGANDTIVDPDMLKTSFDRLTSETAIFGLLLKADHTNWVTEGFTAQYGNFGGSSTGSYQALSRAVTAWFRVHLMNDSALEPMFYGASCGLCTDTATWQVEQKNMN